MPAYHGIARQPYPRCCSRHSRFTASFFCDRASLIFRNLENPRQISSPVQSRPICTAPQSHQPCIFQQCRGVANEDHECWGCVESSHTTCGTAKIEQLAGSRARRYLLLFLVFQFAMSELLHLNRRSVQPRRKKAFFAGSGECPHPPNSHISRLCSSVEGGTRTLHD
jgi:hypothetical protein